LNQAGDAHLEVTDLLNTAKAGVAANRRLKEALANTVKVMDPTFGSVFIYEAKHIKHRRIWPAQRDLEMWKDNQN
jgi:hypothetical protein